MEAFILLKLYYHLKKLRYFYKKKQRFTKFNILVNNFTIKQK